MSGVLEVIKENQFFRFDLSHTGESKWTNAAAIFGYKTIRDRGYFRNFLTDAAYQNARPIDFDSNGVHLSGVAGAESLFLKYLSYAHENIIPGGLCSFKSIFDKSKTSFECIGDFFEKNYRAQGTYVKKKKELSDSFFPILIKANKERYKHLMNLDWKE